MKSVQKISVAQRVVKVSSTLLMFFCLVFLTGVNFIIFPQEKDKAAICSTNMPGKSNDDPSAPVEEKSSSNTSLSVQEEYLHEKHNLKEFERLEEPQQYAILGEEKLQIVHFELISPPPKA